MLRGYQIEVNEQVHNALKAGIRRIILAMPTGSGKTVTAAGLINRYKGEKALFIVDRVELIEQAELHLEAKGLEVGILQGENTRLSMSDEVIVASIQTINRRNAPPVDYVIIDEVNNLHGAHIRLMESWNNLPFIGLSATPLRPDLGKYFELLIRGPSVKELTELAYLVPAKAYCPSHRAMRSILEGVKTQGGDFKEAELSQAVNTTELVGDVVRTWQDKAEDRQTLCFAVDIAHSKAIADNFKAEGIPTAHLDAYTTPGDRRAVIRAFREGTTRVLCSVNVLGIGFDVPDAACAILARPTLSEALHIQQVGRVLRPAENKTDALLLDHAGNTIRFGLPVHFVVPDLNSNDRPTTKQKRKQVKMIPCTRCGLALESGQVTCSSCGLERPGRFSKVSYIDGELVEFGSDDTGEKRYTQEEKKNWYLAFVWYGEHHNFKNGKGWAFHAGIEKFTDKPRWEWRNLEPVCPTEEQSRWIKHYLIKSRKRYEKKKAQADKDACPKCHSGNFVITAGIGPHAAGRRCADCDQFLGWIPKERLDALRGEA